MGYAFWYIVFVLGLTWAGHTYRARGHEVAFVSSLIPIAGLFYVVLTDRRVDPLSLNARNGYTIGTLVVFAGMLFVFTAM